MIITFLHLHLNLPEKAVICTRCGYALAVDDDRVGRHLGQKHGVSKGARRKLNTLINSLQLPNPEQLHKRSDGSAPHPHLQVQHGAACRHCGLRSTSSTVLSRHIRKLHRHELAATRNTRKHWLRDHIVDNLAFQSWTLKDIKRAWLVAVTPGPASTAQGSNRPLQPVPDSIRDFANQLYHMERGRLELQSTDQKPPPADNDASTPALLTNWMRRTGWDRTFESANCPILMSLSTLPYYYYCTQSWR
ncbi:hypothetical protein DER44DRAFT_858018 [Fusarium oxysporum]|nr:hypothetical protein DER44DRAFT_858018 [Fusarium oxysporum]